MNSKNEIPILLSALLITGGALAGGYWWFSNKDTKTSSTTTATTTGATTAATSSNGPVMVSSGDKNIGGNEGKTTAEFLTAKNAGISALASKNYAQAQNEFKKALALTPNAPETQIYANNAQIGDGKALMIGIAVPMKTDATGALEMLRGIAQAQTEINGSGGINGSMLKVAIADDADDAKVSTEVAETFGKDANILAVVGHFSSGSTLAAAEIYKNQQLVNISPVSSSVKLSSFSKYNFRTIPSDHVAGRALGEYALKTLKKKKALVFFNSQSAYSVSLKSEFAAAMNLDGGSVLQEVDMSAADFNAVNAVTQSAGAEVIMMAANTGTLEKAMQVVTANDKKVPLLGGDDVYSPKTLELGKEKAVGLVVAVPWHIDADPKAKFAISSRKFWKADVNWRTALTYDATQSLIVALKTNPTRSGIQQALSAPGFQAEGSAGQVKYLPSGDRSAGIQLVQVAPGNKSKLGFDFVPVKK
jgi:branched-chain amino acid transport system substrate-binding protein